MDIKDGSIFNIHKPELLSLHHIYICHLREAVFVIDLFVILLSQLGKLAL